VAYKQDIDDYRESPALKIIDLLQANGALVKYFDPYISQYRYNGKIAYGLDEINCEVLQEFDLVMITTAHTSVDYKLVQEN
ncbi:UDP-N-acetyl-D-glucosamine dehydrogenase, partial [Phocaeicola vulgatus]|uniref:UDP-glucose/GDP-mannose dehydrogenase family protein n=2 Tax=Bacteria TaxID=2 RepID=UPI0021D45923